MNQTVRRTLETIAIGIPQHFGRLTVFPLAVDGTPGPEYLTMGEALDRELLTVTEISEGGSVPELKVRNDAELPVLILDGEELRGAKQNRVVNATLLLKEKSETIIPVSCTEHGRWHHVSPKFSDSDAVMPRQARAMKTRSVSEALKRSPVRAKSVHDYRSDQGGVWDQVEALHYRLETSSPTGAMSDAYDRVQGSLDEALACFPREQGQAGLLVYFGTAPMGLDLVSRPQVFERLHRRLLKSYVIDVLRTADGDKADLDAEMARMLLATLPEVTRESAFQPIGHGEDFRYENGRVFGSALVHQDTCIHTAFFWDDERPEGREPGFARFEARRRLRS